MLCIYIFKVRYTISYNKAACPPAIRQGPDNMLNLLDVDFWLWYRKVTPKGIAHAFRIRFWEMFSAPGTYDILTEHQYKIPNSNEGCMWLRAPTACPKWNEGTDEDITVLHWLSKNAGLTSECITEVIEPFARQRLENTTHGMMWNEAAKQVMWPPPHPTKAVELTTVLSSGEFNQYTLLARLTDAEAQSKCKISYILLLVDIYAQRIYLCFI